jgi:UDP-3-O-[3-hydroxymyristoyl] glucosamine N-acyltransferase
MRFKLSDIATLVNGKIEGDTNAEVIGFAKIEEGKEGDLCFLANDKYESHIYQTKATAVIVNKSFEAQEPIHSTLLRVDDAYTAFTILLDFYHNLQQKQQPAGIENGATIHQSVKVAKSAFVGALSYIDENVEIDEKTLILQQVFIGKNVKIGKNCVINPGVKIYNNCIIGDNCILHSNLVIGADGFGFAPQNDGTYKKIPQTGNVILENNIEIGANTSIDRAVIGSTIIRNGVKIDNLCQIAHNVEIGENTVIAAQTGIAGSTKIGKNCMIGGQVGIVGHITIADGTKIQAQSGIAKPVKEPGIALYGSPAIPYGDFIKSYVEFKTLPDLAKKVKELESIIRNEKSHE